MAGCEFGWKEDFTFFSSLVTWVVVYFGWTKVHQLTLERERRKEKRDSAAKLVEQVRKVEQEAIDFHRCDDYNGDLREVLISAVGRISRTLQRPPYAELAVNSKIVIAFRKSITLKNADQTEFKSQRSNSPLVYEIRMASDELVEAIESAKECLYR